MIVPRQERELIVVDREGCRSRHAWARQPARVLNSYDALREQVKSPRRNQLWVALHPQSANWIGRALASRGSSAPSARLLLFCSTTPELLPVLYSGFRSVITADQACLRRDEFMDVIGSAHPGDSCIAAAFHAAGDHLVLWRGDFTSVVVSLDDLPASTPETTPEPMRLALSDRGRTIALGHYRLYFDTVLCERDPKYRRRANASLRNKDESLGGCLRRLRLLRGVPRDGFQGLSEKTVARIERGEVATPRKRTLNRIASRLGVDPDEIMRY